MKMLYILAAAATLAACHHNQDEMGAAPERGDTTAVTRPADTTMAQPSDTTMNKVDTTRARTDTTMAPSPGVTTDTSTTGQQQYPNQADTTRVAPSPGAVDTTAQPTQPTTPSTPDTSAGASGVTSDTTRAGYDTTSTQPGATPSDTSQSK